MKFSIFWEVTNIPSIAIFGCFFFTSIHQLWLRIPRYQAFALSHVRSLAPPRPHQELPKEPRSSEGRSVWSWFEARLIWKPWCLGYGPRGFRCFNFKHHAYIFPWFSRMRSKGSRFTLGVWGLRVCSLDVAFTVATVRNRPCEDCMAVPIVSSAEVIFGGFQRFVASFRVAGVALRDIQTCFVTRRKLFCVAGAILLRCFQKMRGSFRGRCSTLDVTIVVLRGRRSTLDVSCSVFFANRIGRAASSGEKVQIPWQAWHFVRCTENWRKPRTKHRFGGSTFRGS